MSNHSRAVPYRYHAKVGRNCPSFISVQPLCWSYLFKKDFMYWDFMSLELSPLNFSK